MLCGVDIGGTKCAVCIGDTEGGVYKKIRFATESAEKTLENITSAIEKLGGCEAIGISCGGPLDPEKGIIMSPPNLPGWDNIEIADILKKRFSVPCAIQNDANACTLAEWRLGAGRGCQNMIFLTFGTGMGAGLILNGRLYTGASNMAGEIGHVRMCGFGPVGYGKSGSFEGFCSGGGIAELGKMLAKERLQNGEKTMYCEKEEDIGAVTAKSIAECAEKGDAAAIKVYDICAEKLGCGIAVLIDILNPEMIVIGSIFERSGHLLADKMNEKIAEEALRRSRDACTIKPAALGDDIGDYAALAIAADICGRATKNE